MEMGEGSSSKGEPKRKTEGLRYEQSVGELSKEGRKTFLVVEKKRKKPLNTIDGTSSAVFDNTCPQYNWLYDGWLVEERRIIMSGRLYRVMFSLHLYFM